MSLLVACCAWYDVICTNIVRAFVVVSPFGHLIRLHTVRAPLRELTAVNSLPNMACHCHCLPVVLLISAFIARISKPPIWEPEEAFQAKYAKNSNRYIFRSVYQIDMKFDSQLRVATETSWVVSYGGKTIPRWRTAAILKIVISPYLNEKSADEKVALDRLRVRQNVFLLLIRAVQTEH